jgi:Zn-finger nucleic acid-binding protein
MQSELYSGITLDVCPACEGIWFDPDELRILLKQGVRSLDGLEKRAPTVEHRPGGRGKLLCPDDRVLLEEYHYMYSSPAVLETCPTCGGFFVAQSELAKIQSAYLAAHAPPTAKEEAGIELAVADAHSRTVVTRAESVAGLRSSLQVNAPGWFGLA